MADKKPPTITVTADEFGVLLYVADAGSLRCDYPVALALLDRLACARGEIVAKQREVIEKERAVLQARLDALTARLTALGGAAPDGSRERPYRVSPVVHIVPRPTDPTNPRDKRVILGGGLMPKQVDPYDVTPEEEQ